MALCTLAMGNGHVLHLASKLLVLTWHKTCLCRDTEGRSRMCFMQVNGQRGMDEVFAEIDGVLSAFSEDETPKAAAL